MDRQLETIEVCADVEKVLNELPRTAIKSRQELLVMHNLWRIEIPSTCGQILDHYQSVLLLTNQRLPRPAAALSRSIHEAAFRFEYLASNENELQDWTEWQISRDYHASKDTLQYDTTLSAETRCAIANRIRTFEDLLGGPPPKPPYPWKSTSVILSNLASGSHDGIDKRLRRLLIEYPSTFVHIRVSEAPSVQWTVRWTETSVLVAMQTAMELCQDKGMVSHEMSETARKVAAKCKNLLQAEDADGEPC